MSGPLQMLLGVGAEQKAQKERAQQQQVQLLGELLDRPDVTLDAKEAIATHLEDLTNVGTKAKGLLPLFTRIFHHQQQTQANIVPDKLFGDLNERIPTMAAGPDKPAANPDDRKWLDEIGTPPSVEGRRLGSMTSGEVADERGMNRYRQQREVLSEIDRQNDERTRQRQLEVQGLRNQGAAQRLSSTLQNRLILLDATEQARARRDVEQVNAAHPDWTPDQAAEFVADKYQSEQELKKARVNYMRAMTDAIPERLRMEGERVAQGWQRLDLQEVRDQVLNEVSKAGADAKAFDEETKPLFNELQSVRRQIEYFNKFSDTASATKLAEMQRYESDLLNQIWQKKGQYVKPQTPVPQRNSPPQRGRGSKYVAPRVSQSDLNKVLGLP